MLNARRFMKWYSFISIAAFCGLFLQYFIDSDLLTSTPPTVYTQHYFISEKRQRGLAVTTASHDLFKVSENDRAVKHTTISYPLENMLLNNTEFQNVTVSNVPSTAEQKTIQSNKFRKIIWYDAYNDGHGLRNKGKHIDFRLCPYNQCVRMPDYIRGHEDRSNNDLKSADAIIFQGIHYEHFMETVPRQPGQIFVFAERESGWHIGCNKSYSDPKYINVFNWTMTFRRDSDIPMLYGDILSKSSPERKLLTDEWKQTMQSPRTKSFSDIYADKDLDVVWLVSHCKTRSLRENYVAELRKYIPVSIIGGCGEQSCPKKHAKQCLADITKRYKFILSFENTFQTDYVTEKLYGWISRDIIQVVYGLAEYRNIVPKGTVINAANFVSPKDLADYLKALGSNKAKYIHNLRRKDQYFSVQHTEMQQRAYCQVCEMLHNIDSYRKTYPNIATWWQTKDISRINSFVYNNVTQMINSCEETR